MPDRLALATAFVAALEAAHRRYPSEWHRVASIRRYASVKNAVQFERALRVAADLGLVQVYGDRVRLLSEVRRT